MFSFVKTRLILSAFVLLALCWPSLASYGQDNANIKPADKTIVVTMSKELAAYKNISAYANDETGRRFKIMDIAMRRSTEDANDALSTFLSDDKTAIGPNRNLIPVFKAATKLRDVGADGFVESASYRELLALSSSDDWFVANRALIILSLETFIRNHMSEAFEFSQQAVNKIPVELQNPLIDEARYDTLDLLHTLFVHETNIPETVKYTKEMIGLGIKTERRLDALGILHNMVEVYYEIGDFETALQISQIMDTVAIDETSQSKILVYYDIGRSNVALENFEEAAAALQKGLALKPAEPLNIVIMSYLSLSLAQTGDNRKSLAINDKAMVLIHKSDLYRATQFPDLLKAKAIVLQHTGNLKEANTLLNEWSDVVIENKSRALTNSRIDSANNLSATQDLKNEKIDRLIKETHLNEQILMRTYMVLAALSVILVLLAIALVYMNFNRRRLRKLNAELAIQRDLAQAGERAKSRFLAMISHELRTPLNGILAMSDHIANSSKDEGILSAITIVQQSGHRLFFLIKNVLLAADVGQGPLDADNVLDIKTTLSQIINPWAVEAKSKGLGFAAKGNASLNGEFKFPKDAVTIVLDNLISNALKFTSKGSIEIFVNASNLDTDNPALLISVQDTGVGMSDELIEKATRPFLQDDDSLTRHHDGAGLGLHVCAKVLESLGGKFAIVSEDNQGTTVAVTLPVTKYGNLSVNSKKLSKAA